MEKPIIVITGPTASGKTSLSIEVISQLRKKGIIAEVVCADSMTVYKGMDIGTDKPTLIIESKDRKKKADGSYMIEGIKHHLLDIVCPDEEFNVAIFKEKVTEKINKIHSQGHFPFLVGGSLFYLDAYLYNFTLPPVKPDLELRKKLRDKSNEELFKAMCELDPDAEWTIDRHNKRRLIRALEVCLKTGKPFTKQKSKMKIKENVLYLGVSREREELYKDINKRVEEMMTTGFLEEVRELYQKYDSNTAMQAAGYKQLSEYIEGKISLEKAIENTKRVHRNFAKRQLTWMKKNPDIIKVENAKTTLNLIENFVGQR